MPEQSVARLFVEPRQIERLIAASPTPSKAADARIMAMLERYLGAVEYAAASLAWNDTGIVVQTVETLDRSKLDPWLLRWAGNNLRPDVTLARVPDTTLASPRATWTLRRFLEAISEIVPEEDQPKLKNLDGRLDRPFARSRPAHPNSATARAECDRVRRISAGRFRRRSSSRQHAGSVPSAPFAQVLVVSLQKDESVPAPAR